MGVSKKMAFRGLVLAALSLALAEAFTATPVQSMMLRRAHTGAVAKIRAPTTAATRPVRLALRMQSEDDKAKAAGVALFFVGLVWSGFSVFVGVLAGGAAIYAPKSPEEGDKGVSDTAKQVSLLVGSSVLKAFDFVKEKDAGEGLSKKIIEQVKGAVEEAKTKIDK